MFDKVFITAEAGSNHNGDLGTAVELVQSAARKTLEFPAHYFYVADPLPE